jgi:hypothetical protein
MFPWESAFSGLEVCPLFAETGQLEQHISGDISMAVKNYWYMTGNLTWLEKVGFPLASVSAFLLQPSFCFFCSLLLCSILRFLFLFLFFVTVLILFLFSYSPFLFLRVLLSFGPLVSHITKPWDSSSSTE